MACNSKEESSEHSTDLMMLFGQFGYRKSCNEDSDDASDEDVAFGNTSKPQTDIQNSCSRLSIKAEITSDPVGESNSSSLKHDSGMPKQPKSTNIGRLQFANDEEDVENDEEMTA